ncbi:MAG: Leu/Phe/Val dehydrogenase [Hyphomicrobiaceae bacterium]
MSAVFDTPAFDNHEQVIFCSDASTGLQAIIAIHATSLGPAAGGCRMYPYETPQMALNDALRLSRGMSYKNALAGLKLGGGKAVIIADPNAPDKSQLLTAFARHVQTLGGRYWTAIDVGVGVDDVALIARETNYVFCRVDERSGRLNPATYTALGGFVGLKTSVRHALGRDDLVGVRFALQGLGQTGFDLCQRLIEAGGSVVASDVDQSTTERAHRSLGVAIVDPQEIYDQAADVFVPCALGAILNDSTIPRLKVRVVCGLANNQLAEPRHGQLMLDRGIVYAPDYVVNAGGVIYGSDDIFKTHDTSQAETLIAGIDGVLSDIFCTSDRTRRPTSEIADELARSRMVS